MKKLIFSFLLALVVATFAAPAQCGEAVKKVALQEMGDSQYIKDYSVELIKNTGELKTGQVKFNVLLNNRNLYKFNVVNGKSNSSEIIMQLYDKDKQLVSNFEGGKTYKGFQFGCRSTKMYQLVFSIQGGEEGCAEAVLSLVKQFKEGEEMGF